MVKFYYSYKHDLRNRNAPLVTEHAIQRLDDDPIETTAPLSRQHLSISAVPLIIKILLGEISQLRSPMDDRARGAAFYDQTLSLTTRRHSVHAAHIMGQPIMSGGAIVVCRPRPPAGPPTPARPPAGRRPPACAALQRTLGVSPRAIVVKSGSRGSIV